MVKIIALFMLLIPSVVLGQNVFVKPQDGQMFTSIEGKVFTIVGKDLDLVGPIPDILRLNSKRDVPSTVILIGQPACGVFSFEPLADGGSRLGVSWENFTQTPALMWDFGLPFAIPGGGAGSGKGYVEIPSMFHSGGTHLFGLNQGSCWAGVIVPRSMIVDITFTATLNGIQYTSGFLMVPPGTTVQMRWTTELPDAQLFAGLNVPSGARVSFSNFGASATNGSRTFIATKEDDRDYLLGVQRGNNSQTASANAHLYVYSH